ncbi:hypothetical protein GF373_01205 [bacterium]|nr:hypothetical protein [bacterium]
MFRFFKKTLKLGFFLCFFLFIGIMAALAASIAPKIGDYLFCVQIDTQQGDHVDVAIPLSILNTSFHLMPKEIQRICRELELDSADIIRELQYADGEDIVHIQGKDKVRVFVTSEQVIARGFVKIWVREHGENGNNVYLLIPRGLLALAGNIVSLTGVVDKYVEVPDEIKNLTVQKL